MVQPKRAEKAESFGDFLGRTLREFNERNPIIREAWAVEEIRPAYNTGGYYDRDVPEERKRVSPFFDTKGLAEEWMSKHEADKGKHLKVSAFVLREYRPKPYTQWVRVR